MLTPGFTPTLAPALTPTSTSTPSPTPTPALTLTRCAATGRCHQTSRASRHVSYSRCMREGICVWAYVEQRSADADEVRMQRCRGVTGRLSMGEHLPDLLRWSTPTSSPSWTTTSSLASGSGPTCTGCASSARCISTGHRPRRTSTSCP